MSTGPSDDEVDAELELAVMGYDRRDKYPEWSNASMRRCGVNRTAVCRWETEETRTPRLSTVVAYAHALGMRLTLVPHDAHVIIKCLHTWTTGTGPGDPKDTGVHTCQREGHHVEHRCTCGASIITATA